MHDLKLALLALAALCFALVAIGKKVGKVDLSQLLGAGLLAFSLVPLLDRAT